MRETLRGVRTQEYRKLWGNVPRSLGSALWIFEVAVLGWAAGYWLGAATMAGLTVLARLVPSHWRAIELVVDVCYVTTMRSFVLRVMWLLLIADLWLIQGYGPLSILMVLGLFVAAMLLPFAMRRIVALVPAPLAQHQTSVDAKSP